MHLKSFQINDKNQAKSSSSHTKSHLSTVPPNRNFLKSQSAESTLSSASRLNSKKPLYIRESVKYTSPSSLSDENIRLRNLVSAMEKRLSKLEVKIGTIEKIFDVNDIDDLLNIPSSHKSLSILRKIIFKMSSLNSLPERLDKLEIAIENEHESSIHVLNMLLKQSSAGNNPYSFSSNNLHSSPLSPSSPRRENTKHKIFNLKTNSPPNTKNIIRNRK